MSGGASILLFGTAYFRPQTLNLLNSVWYSLGVQLGRIVNPILMGLIFFLMITPVAFFTRMFGRDELALKRPPVDSYWQERDDKHQSPESFINQY